MLSKIPESNESTIATGAVKQFTLSDLPKEALRVIFDFLDYADRVALGSIDRQLRRKYKIVKNEETQIAYLGSLIENEPVARVANVTTVAMVDCITLLRHEKFCLSEAMLSTSQY